jgi:hypothetical protein
MPIVIIIIGLAVAVGVGGYFLRPEAVTSPEPEPVPEVRDAETVPDETGDNALERESVPPEAGDNPTGTPEPVTPVSNEDILESAPAVNSEAATEPASSVYANGSYDINTSYLAPNRANHTVAVSFTLTNDVVTAAKISFGGDEVATSQDYQNKFVAAYESQVIGKKLDSIKLSRVGGASLTSNAFNDAVAKVKVAAQN